MVSTSGIGVRLCYGHKVLYGYTNLADRNELLRIVQPCWRPKDRRDPVVTVTAFDFTRLTDRNPWLCRCRPTSCWSRR